MCILLNVKKHEKTFALNVDIFKSCTKPGANLTFPCGKYIVNLVRKKKINRPGSLTDQAESWLHRQDPYT